MLILRHLAWLKLNCLRSKSGLELMACSSDGTVAYIEFNKDEIGDPMAQNDVVRYVNYICSISFLKLVLRKQYLSYVAFFFISLKKAIFILYVNVLKFDNATYFLTGVVSGEDLWEVYDQE